MAGVSMTACLTCGIDRTVVVTSRDFRGKVTSLCRACGGGEDQEDAKAAGLVGVKATMTTKEGT